MLPEVAEAIRIADKHLSGGSNEQRRNLALEIQQAIMTHAERISRDTIGVLFQQR
jgi:hypothetical protein